MLTKNGDGTEKEALLS